MFPELSGLFRKLLASPATEVLSRLFEWRRRQAAHRIAARMVERPSSGVMDILQTSPNLHLKDDRHIIRPIS
jgi:hypothetical protein